MFLLTLALGLTGGEAQASAYYFSPVGVRALSRGGAYIAGADDLTALYHNPATLTRIKDGQFKLDMAAVSQNVYFDRDDYPGEGEDGADLITDPIENEAPAYMIPHLALAWSFGLPNTTVAIGFYPPYAPDYAYPEDGAQRYTLINTLVIQTIAGLSVAHEFFDWVSIGGGLSYNTLIAEQELAVSLSTNLETETPIYDVRFNLRGVDKFELTGNLGLLVEPPGGRWAVGGMWQPAVNFEPEGYMEADFGGNFFHEDATIIAAETATDDYVQLAVTMPTILKAGALVRPTEWSEIEASFVWQGWSIIDEVPVTDVDMVVDIEDALEPTFEDVVVGPEVVLPAGYEDSWSVRLGGQFDAGQYLTFRLGGLYETSGIPEETVSVSLVDGDKWGVGGGLSVYAWRGLALDMGYFQSWLPDRQITDSTLKAIAVDPFSGEIIDGRTIGNGTLESSIRIMGAGLTFDFGGGVNQKTG